MFLDRAAMQRLIAEKRLRLDAERKLRLVTAENQRLRRTVVAFQRKALAEMVARKKLDKPPDEAGVAS